jgi:hypothetical protein
VFYLIGNCKLYAILFDWTSVADGYRCGGLAVVANLREEVNVGAPLAGGSLGPGEVLKDQFELVEKFHIVIVSMVATRSRGLLWSSHRGLWLL